jgi:hypothetical protein
MAQATAVIVPFHQPASRRRRIDLALALAVLSKGVTTHRRAQRARWGLLAFGPGLQPVDRYEHAKPLGA